MDEADVAVLMERSEELEKRAFDLDVPSSLPPSVMRSLDSGNSSTRGGLVSGS